MTSNSITEIITIYRKMKKGRQNQNTYRMMLNITSAENIEADEIESIPKSKNNISVYDFAKFRGIKDTKYIYYSEETSLLQSNTLLIQNDISELITKKYYWLNIFDPKEQDLEFLTKQFGVHDISLLDIRERNTEEKVEIFKNYTFISLKLFNDTNWKESDDIDFNILLFDDFIITTHDKPWGGINDILNFLHLISAHTNLYPDWVLYSVIIEFLQDCKFISDEMHQEIENVRDVSKADENNIEEILRGNFDLVYKMYTLKNTIKPKVNILNVIKKRCTKRMRKNVLVHLVECYSDFKKQEKVVREYKNILERCQDVCLAIVNMLQSKEGNAMNKSMKWFTTLTFLFLPCQTISGLWGMNVKVPGQGTDGLWWFWILTCSGFLFSIVYIYTNYHIRRMRKKSKILNNKLELLLEAQ